MRQSFPYRAVAYAALLCASILVLLHIATVFGVRPSWGMTLVGWSVPVLVVVALTYIIAMHRLELHARPPLWALLVWGGVMAYDGLNLELERRATDGEYVQQVEGQTVLEVHGQVARRLSRAEGEALSTWELRALTGHLLVFFVVTGVGLLVLVRREDHGQQSERVSADDVFAR